MTKIWFITGSSRGLGRSLTEAVLAKGDMVAAVSQTIAHFGRIDVLVNDTRGNLSPNFSTGPTFMRVRANTELTDNSYRR